ncbi:hypothetical protein SAMN05421821_110109 [Mucilaginibacter lappiensis]|uniref:Uncharacterized protein n=1 Tax=Mucilaginibacter lappiensis TaxID=354630 RepID=A0ABR6PQ06_9SPHI|nr:hypothetical protein [Mucilaginibacter lappiensis]SIR69064.1 hypothetical protein SAMN05421821_110109 [Mucilaginibacter lappiensis]
MFNESSERISYVISTNSDGQRAGVRRNLLRQTDLSRAKDFSSYLVRNDMACSFCPLRVSRRFKLTHKIDQLEISTGGTYGAKERAFLEL